MDAPGTFDNVGAGNSQAFQALAGDPTKRNRMVVKRQGWMTSRRRTGRKSTRLPATTLLSPFSATTAQTSPLRNRHTSFFIGKLPLPSPKEPLAGLQQAATHTKWRAKQAHRPSPPPKAAAATPPTPRPRPRQQHSRNTLNHHRRPRRCPPSTSPRLPARGPPASARFTGARWNTP